MKSFNQFLNECYLSEEEVQGKVLTNRGTAQNFTNPKRIPFTGTDLIKQGPRSPLPDSPQKSKPSPGQMEIPFGKPPTGTTTKVPGSKVRGETGNNGTPGRSPKPYSGTTSPSARVEPAGAGNSQQTASKSAPSRTPADLQKTLADRKAKRAAEEAAKAAKGGELALRPQGSSSTVKTATKTAGKGILGKIAGPASAALDTALSTADERSKGSGWARSLAKGATVAAGGLLGGTAGAIGGGGVLSAATGTAGALAGGAAAEKAFDVAAGANAKQRKQIATANRKSQSGGAIKGIGGPTSFDTKKNTITSGGKTAQLGKTSVVTNPKTGKQEVGNLAYKDGKAVYKRSDTKSLAQTSSNPLERIGRTMFAGAYKKSDAANAAAKLNQARQSDSARNKALGVKMLPGK
jgi:hypothetical protein